MATGWLGEEVYGISQTPDVWLDHQILEVDGALVYRWDALEEMFPAGLLDDLFAAFGARVRTLLAEPEAWTGGRVELRPEAHRALVAAAHPPPCAWPAETLTGLFAASVARSPGAPALIAGPRRLSYAGLMALSRALARGLRRLGAGRDAVVAVVMPKCWQQVPAALGVLLAGAAYLPIDAAQPAERGAFMLRQGGATLALTIAATDAAFSWPAETLRVVLGDGGEVLGDGGEVLGDGGEVLGDGGEVRGDGGEVLGDGGEVRGDEDAAEGSGLAYVIFTSGSTGLPKGVMIEHRSAVNTVLDVNARLGVGAGDRVLALSALAFDLSVYDIFGLLAAGGAIVLPEAAERDDPARWAAHLREGVTVWNTVPALLQALVEHAAERPTVAAAMQSLRVVMLSGDWIPVTLPDALRRLVPRARVIGLGGPTEGTIWQASYAIGAVDPTWSSIPYGRPLTHHRIHVLDAWMRACPVWVPGELYIGGLGLARGYRGDPERTAERFVLHSVSGERLYRSGDWGRWLPDGNLEFLGRQDAQVQIHGYRVELGEIEAALERHPAVRACAVVAVEGRRLVAHVVPATQEATTSPATQEATTSPATQEATTMATQLGHPLEEHSEYPMLHEAAARAAFKLGQPALRRGLTVAATLAEVGALEVWQRRSSVRRFAEAPVGGEALAGLLGQLRRLDSEESPLPKARYGSAGSLYPVQVYVCVAPGRVEGLAGGVYYYHPLEHALARVGAVWPLTPERAPSNEGIAAGAAFAVVLVAHMAGIAPLYGALSERFCLIEAGLICQVLEESAPGLGIGLCHVGSVNFAGLASHPDHALACRQQRGFGGVLSFTVAGGQPAAWRFIDATRLVSITANLGDAKTTIVHPATTTHGRLSEEERRAQGITPELIRVAVGLEDVEDLEEDLARGLAAIRRA